MQVPECLELPRAPERSRVDRSEPTVLGKLGDHPLRLCVVRGDEDVERPSVAAKVVLNAFTTRAFGRAAAISCAVDPAAGAIGSNLSTSIGLRMSTTTLSSSWSP